MKKRKKLKFKRIQARRIKKAIKSISRIDVKIHRIWVNSFSYSRYDIEEKLGHFGFSKDLIDKKRMGNYTKVAAKQIKGRHLRLSYSPKETFIPRIKIEITDPTKKFLIYLYRRFPDLKVSMVEYTIDLFCYGNSKKVRRKAIRYLYFTLKGHIFFPRKKNGNDEKRIFNFSKRWKGIKNKPKINLGYRIYDFKSYERGPDRLKKIYRSKKGNLPYWPPESINRLRLEYTASKKNENRKLYDHKIETLYNFIVYGPKFKEINEKIYSVFKRFKSEKYYQGQLYGGGSFFQRLYHKNRKEDKNIRHKVKEVKKFKKLKKMLVDGMIKFDKDWEKIPIPVKDNEDARNFAMGFPTAWGQLY